MSKRIPIRWAEQRVDKGLAPWIANLGKLSLFLQPYYGDGTYFRCIIKHPRWTMILGSFDSLDESKKVTEQVARLLTTKCMDLIKIEKYDIEL